MTVVKKVNKPHTNNQTISTNTVNITVVKKVNKPHTNSQTISTNTVNITVVKTNKGSNIHQQSIRLYIVNIEKETTLTHTVGIFKYGSHKEKYPGSVTI